MSEEPNRDPRINPVAGDVIRKGNVTRAVDGISEGEIREVIYLKEHRLHICLINTWRQWARNAEIITAASTK